MLTSRTAQIQTGTGTLGDEEVVARQLLGEVDGRILRRGVL